MLFSDQRQHKLAIPAHDKDSKPITIAYLIDYLCQHVMKDSRKELFVLDNHMYVLTHHPFTGLPAAMSLAGCPASFVCLIPFPCCIRHCTRKAFFLMHLHPPIHTYRETRKGESLVGTDAQALLANLPPAARESLS